MRSAPKNVAASVRARLFNLSKQNDEDFGQLLARFAIERLLFRLSVSPHRDGFLLKGATLLAVWPQVPRRPTRDVDFLGTGDFSPTTLAALFRDLCEIEAPEDSLVFSSESVSVAPIREEQRYGGQRVRLEMWRIIASTPHRSLKGVGGAANCAPTDLLLQNPVVSACRLQITPRRQCVFLVCQAEVYPASLSMPPVAKIQNPDVIWLLFIELLLLAISSDCSFHAVFFTLSPYGAFKREP